MCLAKGEYEKLHNKDEYKLKGASKWDKHVSQGRQLAMRLK